MPGCAHDNDRLLESMAERCGIILRVIKRIEDGGLGLDIIRSDVEDVLVKLELLARNLGSGRAIPDGIARDCGKIMASAELKAACAAAAFREISDCAAGIRDRSLLIGSGRGGRSGPGSDRARARRRSFYNDGDGEARRES